MVKIQDAITGRKKKSTYLIINDITGRPYIDERRHAYAFYSMDAAEDFADKVGRAHVGQAVNGIGLTEMSDCFAAGAQVLVERGGGEETHHTLQEEGLLRRHYNNELSADVARYIRTRQHDYIVSMGSCRFLVPVKIRNHPQMSVEYATANIQGMQFKYLAFTDLEEYEKWSRKNEGWSPLEVKASGLSRIGKKHGFLLDACGAKLLISRGMLHSITDVQKEKEGKNA